MMSIPTGAFLAGLLVVVVGYIASLMLRKPKG